MAVVAVSSSAVFSPPACSSSSSSPSPSYLLSVSTDVLCHLLSFLDLSTILVTIQRVHRSFRYQKTSQLWSQLTLPVSYYGFTLGSIQDPNRSLASLLQSISRAVPTVRRLAVRVHYLARQRSAVILDQCRHFSALQNFCQLTYLQLYNVYLPGPISTRSLVLSHSAPLESDYTLVLSQWNLWDLTRLKNLQRLFFNGVEWDRNWPLEAFQSVSAIIPVIPDAPSLYQSFAENEEKQGRSVWSQLTNLVSKPSPEKSKSSKKSETKESSKNKGKSNHTEKKENEKNNTKLVVKQGQEEKKKFQQKTSNKKSNNNKTTSEVDSEMESANGHSLISESEQKEEMKVPEPKPFKKFTNDTEAILRSYAINFEPPVEDISLFLTDALRGGLTALRFTRVEEISFYRHLGLNNKDLHNVAQMPALRSLFIVRCPGVSGRGIAALAKAKQLEYLYTDLLYTSEQLLDIGISPQIYHFVDLDHFAHRWSRFLFPSGKLGKI